MTAQVDVALATFNGAKWLDEQLESIAIQTIQAHVIVGDDQSSDDTLAVLKSWSTRMPGGIHFLPPADTRLGAKANFNRVLSACHSPWVACCDQDDVWLPDHLELLTRGGQETTSPEIIVGDLQVCDSALQPLDESFRHMQSFDAKSCKELKTLGVMNVFPGCAMACSQPLLKLALPIPVEAIQHDWWLSLCSASLGSINIIHQPVGKYRLHESNAIGAKRFSLYGLLNYFLVRGNQLVSELDQCAAMSQTLIARHEKLMTIETLKILHDIVALRELGLIARWRHLRSSGIRRTPWQRQAKMILYG